MWKKHTGSTSLVARIQVLFSSLSQRHPSPFFPEKPCTFSYNWVNRMTSELHCELNASAESARGKKKKEAQILLGSLHSQTVSWNTGEGQAMSRHLYSTWPERDSSVLRAKSSHAALKTESGSSLHKNFQRFGTCISYMLSKPYSSALEVWKQTEEFRVLPPPLLHLNLNPAFSIHPLLQSYKVLISTG